MWQIKIWVDSNSFVLGTNDGEAILTSDNYALLVNEEGGWKDLQNKTLKVIDPVLKQKLNGCGSLTFGIAVDNEYYDLFTRFKTRVTAYEDNVLLFSGRLLELDKDFYNTLSLTFEGDMAMLNDIQYAPYDYSGTIAGLFENVLSTYNSKCVEGNEISMGRITVTDNNNYIARSNSEYSSCWEVLSKKLVELCGGYLCLRLTIDNTGKVSRYLDYLENPGSENTQEIKFGNNIINITQDLKGDEIFTVLYPFGAEDDTTKTRVDISSVNPTGEKFIASENVEKYGRIEAVNFWDDVTLPENLYAKAVEYLNANDDKNVVISVNAVDLHAVDVDIQRLNIGDTVKVSSTPHNIDEYMLITERTKNLNDVSKDTITLGNEEKTFTGYSAKETATQIDLQQAEKDVIVAIRKEIPTEEQINELAREQSKILLGGTGGYFEVLYEDADAPNKPTGFRIMDSNSPGTAQNVVLMNKNGIGFSTNGINGPFYNAWTIDGKLSADYLYTGTLSSRDGSFALNLDDGTIHADKLAIKEGSFDIKAEDKVITSMSENKFQTSNWVLEQYNDVDSDGGSVFIIYKGELTNG